MSYTHYLETSVLAYGQPKQAAVLGMDAGLGRSKPTQDAERHGVWAPDRDPNSLPAHPRHRIDAGETTDPRDPNWLILMSVSVVDLGEGVGIVGWHGSTGGDGLASD